MNASAARDVLHVVFRVGSAEYVLPASVVAEMDSYVGVTPVPGTAPYVVGLVDVRGKVLPLVDLRLRFGLPPVEHTLEHRVVVVERDARRVGLLVDSAREVVKIQADAFATPPDMVVERTAGFVKAVAHVGTRLLMLLDCERVLEQERSDDSAARP